jgi:Mg-chelatase subunit ChlD
MTASRTTATQFVDKVNITPNGNHVAVVAFDSSARLITGLTGNAATAKAGINSLVSESGTRYVPPLQMAQSILNGGRPNVAKVVVFVSDGEANDNRDPNVTTQMVQAEMARFAPGTKMYTIGIGQDGRMTLLLQVMPMNGGISGTANEPNKLEQIYTNIAGELTC